MNQIIIKSAPDAPEASKRALFRLKSSEHATLLLLGSSHTRAQINNHVISSAVRVLGHG